MVSGRPDADRRDRDRGQVLLVGAIVVAFVILALVPVFNAVFAPDSAGNGEPREVGDVPTSSMREHHRVARELAVRVGHTEVFADNDSLVGRVDRALSNYSRLGEEVSFEVEDRYVETTFDPGAPGTVNGTRVVQNESGPLDMPVPGAGSPRNDWTAVRRVSGSGTELGWFVVRLDTTNLSRTEPFTVTVDNETHETTVAVERQDASNDVRLEVTGDVDTTAEPVTCDATSGQVVLDLYRGRSADGDCSFPGLDQVEGPVTVEFENGADARGVYEFVVRQSRPLNPKIESCAGSGPASQPCHSPVLWQLALTTRVDGGRANYSRTANVSVYGGGSR